MKSFSASALVAVLLAWGATGCLIIPTPHSDSGYARTNVVQHTQERFVPGVTTRQDILMALGEPDAVSRDEHQLAYRSEKVVALWIVGGGYSATGGMIYKNHFYIFEFDPEGRFQRAKRTGQLGMVEGSREALLDSPAFSSGGASGVPAVLAGEPVQREHSKSFWLAGVDGYRSKGSTSIVGEPGQLLLTESNLFFLARSRLANTDPVLTLPLASVAEVHIDKFMLGRRLVVRLNNGAVHSFAINTAGGVWPDKSAMQSACDFIQARIKPALFKK